MARGFDNIVEYLLIHGANPLAISVEGKNSLHLAAEYGRHHLCALLYEKYNLDIQQKDFSGNICFEIATAGFVLNPTT